MSFMAGYSKYMCGSEYTSSTSDRAHDVDSKSTKYHRRRVEAEVWASNQGDRVHQEETAAGAWWQTGGGAAEQAAAGEEGEWTLMHIYEQNSVLSLQ